MAAAAFQGTIETVRGALSDERAAEVLEFWLANTGLDEETGRERLPQVVCVALGSGGEIVGVNSVFEQVVAPVGMPFWVYRMVLVDPSSEAELLAAAFDALEQEFDPGAEGPLGLCLPME